MPRMMRPGHGLVLIVFALLTLGVVMVNSAGLTVDPQRAIDLKQVLLGRPTVLALVALLMLLIGSRIPLHRLFEARGLASPLPWIVVGSLALLVAVHVPGIGREVNGARRWITLGPIGFQPSEVAKWALIVVLAWYAAKRAGAMGKFWRGFVPPMLLVGVVCALIVTEDLGTAVLIAMVAVIVLVAGGAKLWHVGLLVPPAVVAVGAALLASPYRLDRLRAFLERRSAGMDLEAISASERSWAKMSSETVDLAGRHSLASVNCLDRSLVLHWLLVRRGIGSELRIGVDREDDFLKAHAWVECGGLVLGNPAEIADLYLPLEQSG